MNEEAVKRAADARQVWAARPTGTRGEMELYVAYCTLYFGLPSAERDAFWRVVRCPLRAPRGENQPWA